MMTPCAGLSAQDLLPGKGDDIELRPVEVLREGGRCGVADRQPLAVGSDPIAVRHPDAGGGAVPGEDDIVVEIDFGEVRQFAVRRLERADILELELLDDVSHPAFAKAFPGEDIDAARAEKRPERHLDGACVGGWSDPDSVIGGNAEHFAGQVDREFELGFAELGAVRTAERRVAESCRGPAGALCAWAGRKARVCGPNARRSRRHDEPSFQMGASRWGEVSRCGSYRNRRTRASGGARAASHDTKFEERGQEPAHKLFNVARLSKEPSPDFAGGRSSAGSSVPVGLRQSRRDRAFRERVAVAWLAHADHRSSADTARR